MTTGTMRMMKAKNSRITTITIQITATKLLVNHLVLMRLLPIVQEWVQLCWNPNGVVNRTMPFLPPMISLRTMPIQDKSIGLESNMMANPKSIRKQLKVTQNWKRLVNFFFFFRFGWSYASTGDALIYSRWTFLDYGASVGCAAVYRNGDYQTWTTRSCSQQKPFICQRLSIVDTD